MGLQVYQKFSINNIFWVPIMTPGNTVWNYSTAIEKSIEGSTAWMSYTHPS
jgi:hypothetical protein